MKKVVFAGSSINDYCLEASYRRAFQRLGFEVHWFDTVATQQKYVRLGKVGQYINSFIGINAWIKKMQREFVVQVKSIDPDLVIVFCNAPIHVNALAFLKSIIKGKIILLWPDTLFNISAHVATAAPLYDGLASYSRDAIPVFKQMGFSNVHWVPLAADEALHGGFDLPQHFEHDVIFIGNPRPERIKALESISKNFPTLKLGIYGAEWAKSNSNELKPHIVSRHLFGNEFARLMNQSRIAMNIIDDTNYPAANMRFFEACVAKSLQLSSKCPEWEDEYIDSKHLLYFNNEEDLCTKIESALSNEKRCLAIRKSGYQITVDKNTYLHRAQSIIDLFLQTTT
ncbi:MAG: glycosyltransferase [Saprospiraceae bacterium]|nr:glycosyltransferase [Saprospiraceae bacterium]